MSGLIWNDRLETKETRSCVIIFVQLACWLPGQFQLFFLDIQAFRFKDQVEDF